MPTSDIYKKTISRDALVRQYGENTVLRAELASILNIMYVTGIMKPNEFTDIMMQQCQRIEEERRAQANLDEDRG